jgi:hypothetical protein
MTETSNEQRNVLAMVAMVLGIVAIVLSLVVVGGLLGIVALVLGIIAMNRPIRRGMAITGIVTGAVAMLMSVVVILFAVLLGPALSHARAAASDVRTMANLRQLGLGLLMYSNENRGLLPPSIAYVGRYVGSGAVLQDPRVHTQPTLLPAGSSWLSDPAAVESSFDFVYVGRGLQINRLRNVASFILMYDKPVAGHQRLVAFGDGHVERFPQASAQLTRVVQATNQTRTSLNLPPLPLDLSGPP